MNTRVLTLTLSVLSVVCFSVAAVNNITLMFPWAIPSVAGFVVGAVLAWRKPVNPIGWLLFAFGASGFVAGLTQSLAIPLDDATAAGWLDAVGYSINTPGVVLLVIVFLRFPNGRLLGPGWRWVERVGILTAVLGATASLLNGGWGGDPKQATAPSPLRETTAPIGDVLSGVFFGLMIVTFIAAAVSLIIRYRQSEGDERLQMKWLAYAGAYLILTLVIAVAMTWVNGDWTVALESRWQQLLVALAFTGIPAAIGVAVLQYRLYEIDLVISRTLVLAVLAGFITIVYALIVVGIGNLVGGDSDGLFLPIAATAVVASAFEPVRLMAQRWANRVVYGRRASPYEVLSDLTERLSHGEEGEGLLARMAARVGDGTGASRATIWLGDEGDMNVGASWPDPPDQSHSIELDAKHVFPVTHDGVVVGAFEVVKPRGTALSSAERSLIADLAGSAGAVLGYQRLNDTLEAKAEELAESRARLVDAQDSERRRLERDLHDGAQQLLVALKVKIGLARSMAAQHDAGDLEDLLEGLGNEAQGALDEVRALAKGIYPPVLEGDGLESAISALASGTPEEVIVTSDALGRYDRDVEAAVYFDISEAVTNAVKHATGPIRVHVLESEGHLRFSVEDAGPGFDVASANGGSGLHNLYDRIDAVGGRLEIVSAASGTTVNGDIPLEPVKI